MKLSVIMLLLITQVHANGVDAQTVSLDVRNMKLHDVFLEFQRQVSYNFSYPLKVTEISHPVTLKVTRLPAREALEKLMQTQPSLSYKFMTDKLVAVFPKKNAPSNMNETVSDFARINFRGKLINTENEPVIGATVSVKNSDQATASDEKGIFFLENIPDNSTLIISSINYKTREFKINKRVESSIILEFVMSNLANVEVVSTGYEQVSRERYVGAYSKLDSLNYNRRIGLGIVERIEGIIPGVYFSKKGGNAPIQIRGISTINAEQTPLIILDNFPYTGDINNINPNDVQDITILKDAAATSIWGTRGGNGVIVITTKRSKFNQPFRVSLRSNITIGEKPDLYYFPRMSSSDFIDVERYLFDSGFYDAALTNIYERPVISPVVEILNRKRNGSISVTEAENKIDALRQLDVRNDYDKYVHQKSVKQEHYLNLSGGNHSIAYNFSFGFNKTVPNIKGSNPDIQYTVSSLNVFRPLKNLEVETSINYSKSLIKSSTIPYPIVPNGGKNTLYPYAQLTDEQGNHSAIPYKYRMSFVDTAGEGKLLDWHYRPLDEIDLADNTKEAQMLRLNLGISYRFTNWLKASIRYQYQQEAENIRNHYGPETFYTRDLINQFTQINGGSLTRIIPLGGILDLIDRKSIMSNARAELSLSKKFNYDHSFNALLAGEIGETKSNSHNDRFYGYEKGTETHTTGLDYLTTFPLYANMGNSRIPQLSFLGVGTTNRVVSLLSTVSYTYDDRYTLYASARRDGANVFGVNTNNKWKPLWSAGATWNISKESFYKAEWTSYLRMRTSYGYSGNVQNTFSGLPTMAYFPQGAEYTNLLYGGLGSAPNPDLRWEEVGIFNVGIDFGLFKDRVTGTIDWYHKKSKDLIATTPLDPTVGVSEYMINIASLKGTGFELKLSSKNTTGKIRWSTELGFSYNKTIVTKFNTNKFNINEFVIYGINPREGEIAWGVYSYRWAGLDPTTGDPRGFLNKEISQDYTSIINDSVKNQVFHGSSRPLYFGNLMNSISWKNFSISANITYSFSYYFRKPTLDYNALYNSWDGHSDFTKRWKKPGDETFTTVPSMTYPSNANRDLFYAFSEVNVEKGDHIRLQDVGLSYNWNNSKNPRFPIRSVQFTLYCNNTNLMLWKANNSGLDPDYTGGSTNPGFPPIRTWSAGINLNF